MGNRNELLGFVGILLVLIIGIGIAQSQEDEIMQLEQELIDAGYDWLVDYSGELPVSSIEVYEENGEEVLALFENVFDEGWYKIYLTELEESQDVFDLRVLGGGGNGSGEGLGGVEFDYIVDPTINISDVSSNTDLNNITAENNFTHLTISEDAPYDDLVLYMPFDDNVSSTTAYDYTKKNNDGNFIGNPSYGVSGWIGGGLELDGAGDYIEVPYNPSIDLLNNFTLSIWFKVDKWLAYASLLSERSSSAYQFQFRLMDGDELNFLPSSGGAFTTSSLNIQLNEWHMASVTFTDGNVTIWFDGHARDSATGKSMASKTLPLHIGASVGATSYYFNGTIDEVMIFNTSLTATQISDIYNNQSARFKNGGEQGFGDQSVLNITAGVDTVRVTGDYEALIGSSINLSVGYYDGNWQQTTDQIFDGDNSFTITTNTTNLTLNYTFVAGPSGYEFYSPILSSNANSISVNVSATPGMNNWICSSTERFDNSSCWTLGRMPITYDDVIFNGTGTGDVNITNNTMPQYLNSFTVGPGYTGVIYFNGMFGVGSWGGAEIGTQVWNVTNNINISGGTMKIYGDYIDADCCSVSANGQGQEWHSISGNVSVGVGGVLDGVGLGFPEDVGPAHGGGGGAYDGGGHGGRGQGNVKNPYGNATAPISIGSGGEYSAGGSAIKLHAIDLINVLGSIDVSGVTANRVGAGGSIWLKAANISGSGTIKADGGTGSQAGGGGGRIRLEHGGTLELTGTISVDGGSSSAQPGTLTFTNNTWPGDWNLTGNIGLLGGDHDGDGINVTNVEGYFDTNGYDVTIYGDCFYDVTNPVTCFNKIADGRGVWINASGNITISSGSVLDGVGLGFPILAGPGAGASISGGSYGGRSGKTPGTVYGSETEPISLGSGGGSGGGGRDGGSAIKLQTDLGTIVINGEINIVGVGGGYSGSGGSIWLKADNISGSGLLNAGAGQGHQASRGGGGGGRIVLTSNVISFTGVIENEGDAWEGNYFDGSGGTVYINATTSITSSGNISVVGYNGTASGSAVDWGQRINISSTLVTLSGIYNASTYGGVGTINGTITVGYSDCSSSVSGATFIPDAIYEEPCLPTLTIISPVNNSNYNVGDIGFNVSVSEAGSWCGFSLDNVANVTMTEFNSTWFTYTNTSTLEGNHNITFSCNDTSGNIDTSVMHFFLVDTVGSNISFDASSDANASTRASADILVNLTSSDAGDHYAFADFDNDLVLWMMMDENNGTDPYDNSSYGNHGTRAGDAVLTDAGKFGKGFSFDGVGDYVEVGDSAELGVINNFTVSMWLYDRSTDNDRMLEKGDSYFILDDFTGSGCTTAGRWQFLIKQANSVTCVEVSAAHSQDQWYHVVGIKNDTDIIIYVDGVLKNSNSISGNIDDDDLALIIGGDDGGTNYFNGSIDDVLIFNRALSATEILALYNASATSYENNFTGLSDAVHTFTGHAVDLGGNWNSTGERSVGVDTVFPAIEFDATTPANASTRASADILVNLTSSDAGDHYAFADFDNDLVLWMMMDENNGTDPYDNSSYGNHGTRAGDAVLTDAGKFGKGFSFDGAGDYVDIPSFDFPNISISFWVKTADTLSADAWIYDDENYGEDTGFAVIIESASPANAIKFYLGSDDLSGTAETITKDNWYHVVTTFDENTMNGSIYIDGVIDKSKIFNSASSWTSSQGYLGVANGNTLYLNGTIDDVLIFSRTLSAGEILALYNASATSYENNFTGLAEGSHVFTGHAVDLGGNWNSTGERSVTVQLDTCTAPGAGQWELDCADNCNFTTTTTVPGNVNMSGSGNVYIGANWNFTGSNQYVYVWPGCEVDIYSGGGFNL